MGEWLDDVVARRAADLGVGVEALQQSDRAAAVSDRLRSTASPVQPPSRGVREELSRAEARLSSLFRALDPEVERPAAMRREPRRSRPFAASSAVRRPELLSSRAASPKPKSLADAIAQISERQSVLDRASRHDTVPTHPVTEARAPRPAAVPEPDAPLPGAPPARARDTQPARRASTDPVPPAVNALHQEIAALSRSLGDLAPRKSVASLETAVRDLSAKVGGTDAPSHSTDAALSEVRSMLTGLRDGTGVQVLESRVESLAAKVDAAIAGQVRPEVIDQLAKRIDKVHASLETRLAAQAPAIDLAPLEGMINGLVDRVDTLRRNAEDVRGLEAMVHRLADKLEDARDPYADAEVFADLQAQVGKLAQRIDRSDAGLTAIVSVERSLGELFAQLEETREATIAAAEGAARTAARDTLRAAMQEAPLAASRFPAENDALAGELQELRASRDEADRRMALMLSTVNMTLEQVVARLVALDAASARRSSPEAREPEAAPPGRSTAPVRAPEPPRDVVDLTEADVPIEPGQASVRPRASRPEGAAPEVSADPAQFIAAARRAAQAAAQDHAGRTSAAAAQKARGGASTEPAPAAGPSLLGRARTAAAARRRPMLLSLAALVLLLGAAQVARLSLAAPGTSRTETAALDEAAVAAPIRADTAQAKITASADPSAAAVDAVEPAAAAPKVEPAPAAVRSLPTLAAMGAVAGRPAPSADLPAGLGDGLRDLASNGNAGAQYEVAVRFAEGRGVTRDLKVAATWFEKAAKQGIAPAEYRLGSLYEKGLGVARDQARAVDLYAKAAEAGNVRAMHNLAVLSAEGAGGKSDYAKAAQWFTKASLMGVRDSQFNLAILYARGLGIEQSMIESYKWFTIAAGQGDEDAAKKRDEVGARLDPKALASAKAAADDFKPLAPLHAANDVQAPPGGWDALTPTHPSPVSDGAPRGSNARVSSM